MSREKPNDQFTEYEVPWIEPDGDIPFRYRVESASDPLTWHVVDLTDRGGHGACSCTDFQTRANPNFRRHGKHIPYAPRREGRSECVHLRSAFEYFHVHTTIPMLAQFKNGISPHAKP